MATPPLGNSQVNFTLDKQSSSVIAFPIVDLNGNPVDVSSGWSVKGMSYCPMPTPNGEADYPSLLGYGVFTYVGTNVIWTLPNSHGIIPLSLVNNYALVLSNDGGSTGCLASSGQFTYDIENYIIPL